jgi:hypothetical protein
MLAISETLKLISGGSYHCDCDEDVFCEDAFDEV